MSCICLVWAESRLTYSSDKLTEDKRAKTVSGDDDEPVSSTIDQRNSAVGYRKQSLESVCSADNEEQLPNLEIMETLGSGELVAANDEVGSSTSRKKNKKKKKKKKEKKEKLGNDESKSRTLPVEKSQLCEGPGAAKEPTGGEFIEQTTVPCRGNIPRPAGRGSRVAGDTRVHFR